MKKYFRILVLIGLAILMAACSTNALPPQTEVITTESIPLSESTATESVTESESATTSTAIEALSDTHEDAADYSWDATSEIQITLTGETASASSSSVEIDGGKVTITAGGNYRISGDLAEGQLVVNTTDDTIVRLILDGANITNTTGSPIYVLQADKVILILADGSQNTLTDSASYSADTTSEDEPNATLFSKVDLSIAGNGSLTINGNYNDGISSKDGLIIAGGTIVVNAIDDGIRGKDYLVIKDGNLTVTTNGGGLKSDNEEDATLGFIEIFQGNLDITAGGDAISAQSQVHIEGGTLTLASGGGSGTWLDDAISAKGIKGEVSVIIEDGIFNINSADDAIHSNGDVVINGGTYQIATGDDGMHADTSLTINSGEITIIESYEGIESAIITLNDGNLHINASDDGINIASGMDGSSMDNPFFGAGNRPQPGTAVAGGFGQDSFTDTGNNHLSINGGYVYVNAQGDGIDTNGSVEMTDGIVLVDGPTDNGNGALDYSPTFNISGGILVAAGSAGMAMAPSTSSSQNSLLINVESALPAGTAIHIEDETGNTVLTFVPAKTFQSIVISSPLIETGKTYSILTGGEVDGEVTDGLSTSNAYSGGTEYNSFTVEGVLTTLGTVTGFGPGGGHRR